MFITHKVGVSKANKDGNTRSRKFEKWGEPRHTHRKRET